MTPTPLLAQVQEWRKEAMRLVDAYANEGRLDYADEHRTALLAHLSAVPFNQVVQEPLPEMVLVPRLPTKEMLTELFKDKAAFTSLYWGAAAEAYERMLAASPQPVSQPGEALPAEQPKSEIAYPTSASGGNDLRTALPEACTHAAVSVAFDAEAARDLDAFEVRKRWPRFHGVCPTCRCRLIKYASHEHYYAGDW